MNKRVGIVAVLVLAPVAAATALIVGIRTKYPPVVSLVRRFARDTGNPRVLKSAGTPGGSASIIIHTGRVSGKSFRTPVTPMVTEDGFVIALPYGSDSDWVKNVLAAGSASLVHEGQTYAVQRPEVVSVLEASEYFGTREGRFLRLFGVQDCLRLHRVEAVDSAG